MNRVYLAPIWRILDGMDSGDRWRLGHRPALDGLRGVAIVLVLCAHFARPVFPGAGMAGVTVFFTLSGFLITALLLEEHDRAGRVSFAAFYRRRARRLLPALFAMLVAAAVVQAVVRPIGVTRERVLGVLLYVANWQQGGDPGFNALSHTWSLSIEEQFYLVWPVALWLAMRRWGRRGVVVVGLAGMAVSLAALSLPGADMHGSVERASSLLAGCLLAAWMTGRRESRSHPVLAAAAAVALAPLAVMSGPAVLYAVGVPALTCAVLWSTAQGAAPSWLCGRIVGWFGRRSYGIYLWHYPVIFAVAVSPAVPWYQAALVTLPISLAVAELSWRLIERPTSQLSGWIVVPSHQPEALQSIG